jgi:hypothetical protein
VLHIKGKSYPQALQEGNLLLLLPVLSVVLYGCETWSLALNKNTLMVPENRILKIFGPKGKELIGEWRKFHNEELHNLYSLPNIMRVIKARRMKWAGHVARMGDTTKLYTILVENLN